MAKIIVPILNKEKHDHQGLELVPSTHYDRAALWLIIYAWGHLSLFFSAFVNLSASSTLHTGLDRGSAKQRGENMLNNH